MHAVLERHPRLRYSEYRGPVGLGDLVRGVRNEDICRLTYPDASLDLVLTSDTLEHVPDYPMAFRECRRVLRPGGHLVFTVPMVPLRERTERRATVDGDGRIVHHRPPVYHGRGSGPLAHIRRPGNDLLAFTEFGADVVGELARAGLAARLERAREGLLGDAGLVVSATADAAGPRGDRAA
jgi:SAM-dependent methyltransferase